MAKNPSGQFPAGHLSSRKVYMPSLKKFAALCVTPLLAAAITLPALPQEPETQVRTRWRAGQVFGPSLQMPLPCICSNRYQWPANS